MRISIIFIFILLLASSAFPQFVDKLDLERSTRVNSLGVMPVERPFSLIDLSRVRFSHSYSLSYFSGYANGSAGLWNTSMYYDFSTKLSLAVNVGVMHNTGAIWGDGKNNATFLPGFLLDYHPSEKFRLSIGMQTYSGGLYPLKY
jgi:hypothetical protein